MWHFLIGQTTQIWNLNVNWLRARVLRDVLFIKVWRTDVHQVLLWIETRYVHVKSRFAIGEEGPRQGSFAASTGLFLGDEYWINQNRVFRFGVSHDWTHRLLSLLYTELYYIWNNSKRKMPSQKERRKDEQKKQICILYSSVFTIVMDKKQ